MRDSAFVLFHEGHRSIESKKLYNGADFYGQVNMLTKHFKTLKSTLDAVDSSLYGGTTGKTSNSVQASTGGCYVATAV